MPTFSATVSALNSAPRSNMTPHRRRSGSASSSESPTTSCPNTRIEPAAGCCSRMISRSSVDLPEPLPPTSAKISPGFTARLTSSWTTASPKRVLMPRTSMTVAGGGARLRVHQRSSHRKTIEKIASVTITRKIDCTTLIVVCAPTLSALPVTWKPR